jgi:NAD(P)-dependent dehydrogenase (short-subunit alcohol dehydrogenase family)
MIDEKVPLKQFGQPSDIGNISAFLLSEKARFITGSCIVIDGGQTSKL